MIFLGLFVLALIALGFLWFWGLLIGGIAAWQQSRENRGLASRSHPNPPTHVNLLTRPAPYDWEKDTEGWDGAEELEINEDI